MMVRFYKDLDSNKFEVVKLNAEGVAYMNEVAGKYSEKYSLYVVSIDHDKQGIYFYLDGPWEC